MPTNAQLKTLTNTDIRSKTLANSILKGKVADAIDAGYDYTDQQIENAVGFSVVSVLVSQSSTTTPTLKVLGNNTGATFTTIRSVIGSYRLVSSLGIFTLDKVGILFQSNSLGTQKASINAFRLSDTDIRIQTYLDGVASDDVLEDFFFEIRIYP